MAVRRGPVNKTAHRDGVDAIVKRRFPQLRDPDLSRRFGQVETTTGVVELADEQRVGFASLGQIVTIPTVDDWAPVAHELLPTRDPVAEVEVADSQDDLERAVAFLSSVRVHEVDLRQDAVVSLVAVWPDETETVFVRLQHVGSVLALRFFRYQHT